MRLAPLKRIMFRLLIVHGSRARSRINKIGFIGAVLPCWSCYAHFYLTRKLNKSSRQKKITNRSFVPSEVKHHPRSIVLVSLSGTFLAVGKKMWGLSPRPSAENTLRRSRRTTVCSRARFWWPNLTHCRTGRTWVPHVLRVVLVPSCVIFRY